MKDNTPFPFDVPFILRTHFEQTDAVVSHLAAHATIHKDHEVFKHLVQLILSHKKPEFLLTATLHFLSQIEISRGNPIHFDQFENFLNITNEISPEQKRFVRSQIAGKHLPREAYQVFFPIGMDKKHPGSHFVCAHLSPDVDTMISSFFGWIDAFAAQVGTGIHVWSLPGGAPDSPIVSLFRSILGKDIFKFVARTELQVDPETSPLHEPSVGTVSLRDVSNTQEVKLAPCLHIISVVDHHKCHLKTGVPSTILIADVQSNNTLMAEQVFLMNDRFSTWGLSLERIDSSIKELVHQPLLPLNARLLRRLCLLKHNVQQTSDHFVHPVRELTEYFFFLHAILEDTDLLSKVTLRDVECVAELLNRITSLSQSKVTEVIHFDDIPKDKQFVKTAAGMLLQNEILYSIYKYTYNARESDVNDNIRLCAEGKEHNLFLDTKEQNGCARVGQTKLFASNASNFSKAKYQISEAFIHESKKAHHKKHEIDMAIQMISTITGAEEVYHNQIGPYTHQDELWLWFADSEKAYNDLSHFLAGFYTVLRSLKKPISLTLNPQCHKKWQTLFAKQLPDMPIYFEEGPCKAFAFFRFEPGAVNSRKAMITPFLPS